MHQFSFSFFHKKRSAALCFVFNKKKGKLCQMCSLLSLKAGIRKLCLKKIQLKLTNSYGFNQEMIDQRIKEFFFFFFFLILQRHISVSPLKVLRFDTQPGPKNRIRPFYSFFFLFFSASLLCGSAHSVFASFAKV